MDFLIGQFVLEGRRKILNKYRAFYDKKLKDMVNMLY